MNPFIENVTLDEALSLLFTDISMLKDGEWIPDNDSCDASLDMLERVTEHCKKAGLLPSDYELHDSRDN